MASEKQVAYLKSLAEQRDISQLSDIRKAALKTDEYLENLTNNEVNDYLDLLRACPFLPKPQASYGNGTPPVGVVEVEVAEGRYFIVDPSDNVEKFIKVNKPKPPSRWAGYTFVSVQASDDFYPVKDRNHRNTILRTISLDPIKAMNEYGIRLGVCGCCGRTLTNRDSRLRGLGPICAARILGQPTEDELTLLNEIDALELEGNNDND